MKRNNFTITLLSLSLGLILFVTSCHINDDDGIFNCEKGSGDIILQEIQVADFTGINAEISATIFLYAGAEQLVEVEGQENIIELLELDVQDGIWDIEFDQCVRRHEELIFHITVPYLNYLKTSSSASMNSEDDIITDELYLEVCGSGDMNLDVFANHIDGKISGSGKVSLSGETEELKFKISGSGDLRAFDLTSIFADVNISGSGDMELTALEELFVKISGSGDVYYKGFPIIEIEVTGSGSVVNEN